jgi:hypothetical protein
MPRHIPVEKARRDSKDLPAKRQDSLKKYQVTPEMLEKGSLKGKTAIYVPELKAIIYTKHPEKAKKIKQRYINRTPLDLSDKNTKEAI